jgi:hypothetical protein
MQLRDHPGRPIGTFRLKVFRYGRLIQSVCERNLWVAAGSNNTAQFYGGGGSPGPITTIGFGTNSAPPALTDNALTGSYLRAIGTVTFPSAGLVSFAFTLGSTEANGMAISEFGLLTASSTLCARKNRSTPIYKSAAVTLAGSWSIQF